MNRMELPKSARNLVAVLLLSVLSCAKCMQLPDIYWNSTNTIFDISNTDHVIPVNLLDRVNFICPLPQRGQDEEDYEYSKIYLVSQWAYDNCELSNSKLFGSCQRPNRHSSMSLVFRDFTPLPGGFEFKPGNTYHFISASDGTRKGMDNTKGGLCERRRMKIKFEVLDRRRDGGRNNVGPAGWPVVSDGGAESSQPQQQRDGEFEPVPATTPVMYIIHTKGPDEDIYAPYNHNSKGSLQDVKAEPDGATTVFCSNLWRTIALAVISLIIAQI